MKKNFIVVVLAFLNVFAASSQSKKSLNVGLIQQKKLSERISNASSLHKHEVELVKVSNFYNNGVEPEHEADVLTIYNWDQYSNSFEFNVKEKYSYEEGRVVEIAREILMDDNYLEVEKIYYNYHSGGQLFQMIVNFWDLTNQVWVPIFKEEFQYDDFNNLILESNSQWNSSQGTWNDYYKFRVQYIYNEVGKPFTIEASYWSLFLEQEKWYPSFKEEYTYDSQGRMQAMTYSIPSEDAFIYAQKEEYHYTDDGQIFSGAIVYNWHSNTWKAEYRVTNISWHCVESKLMTSFLMWINNNSNGSQVDWKIMSKSTWEYHPLLQRITLYQEEVQFNNTWKPSYREVSTFNQHNYLVRYEEQYNVGFVSVKWETDYGYSFDGEFNDQGQPKNLVLTIYDWWEEKWLNNQEFVFEYNSTPTTTNPINKVSEFATVFPNPANDIIYITSVYNLEGIHLSIVNIRGQVVKSMSIPQYTERSVVDISNLTSGFYLVKLQTGNSTQVVKLIKR